MLQTPCPLPRHPPRPSYPSPRGGKEKRPNHKCWWQTKNGCPSQASKQLTPNERKKTAETTSKPQTVAYLQAEGAVNTPPNHDSLIDYCLQQISERIQSKPQQHRAKIPVPMTNRWKAKLAITNLTKTNSD